MKYRDDIDLKNTWITSDSHFGHDNIVGFTHRPLDHDQVMIAEWRKEVPDDATVLHLGDLVYRGNGFFKNIVAPELSGSRKLLIKGNHDGQRYSFYKQSGFQLVSPFKLPVAAENLVELVVREHPNLIMPDYSGWDISFSHYPWNEATEGPMPSNHIRIHGHIHNNGYTRDAYVPFLRNHINMSAEQTKFKPVNLKLLLEGYLLGAYPATTEAQLQAAAEKKEANLAQKQA